MAGIPSARPVVGAPRPLLRYLVLAGIIYAGLCEVGPRQAAVQWDFDECTLETTTTDRPDRPNMLRHPVASANDEAKDTADVAGFCSKGGGLCGTGALSLLASQTALLSLMPRADQRATPGVSNLRPDRLDIVKDNYMNIHMESQTVSFWLTTSCDAGFTVLQSHAGDLAVAESSNADADAADAPHTLEWTLASADEAPSLRLTGPFHRHRWNHVALVFGKGHATMYVNSTATSSLETASQVDTATPSSERSSDSGATALPATHVDLGTFAGGSWQDKDERATEWKNAVMVHPTRRAEVGTLGERAGLVVQDKVVKEVPGRESDRKHHRGGLLDATIPPALGETPQQCGFMMEELHVFSDVLRYDEVAELHSATIRCQAETSSGLANASTGRLWLDREEQLTKEEDKDLGVEGVGTWGAGGGWAKGVMEEDEDGDELNEPGHHAHYRQLLSSPSPTPEPTVPPTDKPTEYYENANFVFWEQLAIVFIAAGTSLCMSLSVLQCWVRWKYVKYEVEAKPEPNGSVRKVSIVDVIKGPASPILRDSSRGSLPGINEFQANPLHSRHGEGARDAASTPADSDPSQPADLGDVEMAQVSSNAASSGQLPAGGAAAATGTGGEEAVNPMHAMPTEEERARASEIKRPSLASKMFPSASQFVEDEDEQDEEKEEEEKSAWRHSNFVDGQEEEKGGWRSSQFLPPQPPRSETSLSVASTDAHEDAT